MTTRKSLSVELSDELPATPRSTLAVGVFSYGERLPASAALSLVFPDAGGESARERVRALAEGAHLGLYENDFYRSREDDEAPRVERLTLVGAGESGELREELERARVVAESANWARTLADEPGLSLPPREFARRAAEMAAEVGLAVESLTAAEVRERGMGGLLGVGQG